MSGYITGFIQVLKDVPASIGEIFTSPQPSNRAIMIASSSLGCLVVIGILIIVIMEVNKNSGSGAPVSEINVKESQTKRMETLDAEGFVEGYAGIGVGTGGKGPGTTVAKKVVDPKKKPMVGNGSLYNNLINKLKPSEQYLVNICPLVASIGGFIGPVSKGTFNPSFFIKKALRAGIRAFVLPISIYTDDNKVPPLWPYSGNPAIVYRDSQGKIEGLNGMSVESFTRELVAHRNENSSQAQEPLMIFIKQVTEYLPDPVKSEKKYVEIMHKIAKELKQIDSYRLISAGAFGSAVGGVGESAILTQVHLKDLKDKIIVLTDFQTKLGLKEAYTSLTPSLNEYTNFEAKPIIAQNSGVGTPVGCRMLKIGDVSGSQVNWQDQARTVLHATVLDDPNEMYSATSVEDATRTGIQFLPVPFLFTDIPGRGREIWDKWGGYAWKLKSEAARYMKPEPVVPQTPSAKMNARVSPNLQPGQTSIS